MHLTEESALAAMRKPGTPTDAAARRSLGMANAARHTVLQRIAPALRHDMVVNLQALSMVSEMLSARVERGTVPQADLQSNLGKLNRLSRQAVAKCLDVASWMVVTDEQSVALHDGIAEVVNLLAASFNFRGFGLVNEAEPTEFEVTRHTMRSLLSATLLVLADDAQCPGDLVVQSRIDGNEAVVTVRLRERDSQPEAELPPATHAAPRPNLEWAEVEALATAESAQVNRAEGRVTMRLPRAVVTSPLQMAPV